MLPPASFVKKWKPSIAVEGQHGQSGGEDGECRHDQEVGGKRGPAKHRHPHVAHPGRTYLEDGGDEVDAGHQRAHARDQQRPHVIIDAHTGRVGELGEGRVNEPTRSRKLADDKRDVDQQRTGSGEPEARRVQGRERHIAHPELQRHHKIHEADHQRHGSEENHDRAMRREDLVVVLGRKISGRMESQRLLRAHHDRVDKPAQQHHQAKQHVHDADPLVVHAGDPLAPEVGQMTRDDDPGDNCANDQHHRRARHERDRLVPGDCLPGKLAQHYWLPTGERPDRRVRRWGRDRAGFAASRLPRTGSARPPDR